MTEYRAHGDTDSGAAREEQKGWTASGGNQETAAKMGMITGASGSTRLLEAAKLHSMTLPDMNQSTWSSCYPEHVLRKSGCSTFS